MEKEKDAEPVLVDRDIERGWAEFDQKIFEFLEHLDIDRTIPTLPELCKKNIFDVRRNIDDLVKLRKNQLSTPYSEKELDEFEAKLAKDKKKFTNMNQDHLMIKNCEDTLEKLIPSFVGSFPYLGLMKELLLAFSFQMMYASKKAKSQKEEAVHISALFSIFRNSILEEHGFDIGSMRECEDEADILGKLSFDGVDTKEKDSMFNSLCSQLGRDFSRERKIGMFFRSFLVFSYDFIGVSEEYIRSLLYHRRKFPGANKLDNYVEACLGFSILFEDAFWPLLKKFTIPEEYLADSALCSEQKSTKCLDELHKNFSRFEASAFGLLAGAMRVLPDIEDAIQKCFGPILFDRTFLDAFLLSKAYLAFSYRQSCKFVLLCRDELKARKRMQKEGEFKARQDYVLDLFGSISSSPRFKKDDKEAFFKKLLQSTEVKYVGGMNFEDFVRSLRDNYQLNFLKAFLISLLPKYPTKKEINGKKNDIARYTLEQKQIRFGEIKELDADLASSGIFAKIKYDIDSIKGFVESGDFESANASIAELRQKMSALLNAQEGASSIAEAVRGELDKIELGWLKGSREELEKSLAKLAEELGSKTNVDAFEKLSETLDELYSRALFLVRLQKKYKSSKVEALPAITKICADLLKAGKNAQLNEMLSILLFFVKNRRLFEPDELKAASSLAIKKATKGLSRDELEQYESMLSNIFRTSLKSQGENDQKIELREKQIRGLIRELSFSVSKLSDAQMTKISFFEDMRGILQMLKDTKKKLSEGEAKAEVLAGGGQISVKDSHAWKTAMARYRRLFGNRFALSGRLSDKTLKLKDKRSQELFSNALALYKLLKEAGYEKFHGDDKKME